MEDVSSKMARAARLRQAREAAGFPSAAAAARAIGAKEITYTSHENGQRGLRPGPAARYARKFKVSAAWLLTGQGPRDAKSPGNNPAIGARLRTARIALRFELQDFAKSGGIPVDQYGEWEEGIEVPLPDELDALCNAHGLTLDYIYRGDLRSLPYHIASAIREAAS